MTAGAVRPSAYTSTIMGAQAGGNVARDLAGKPTKPLRFGYLQQAVSLGRRDGLVQFTDGNDRPSNGSSPAGPQRGSRSR